MEVNGTILLQRSHAYYYKVQTQMAVCQVKYCDCGLGTKPSSHRTHKVGWRLLCKHFLNFEKVLCECSAPRALRQVFQQAEQVLAQMYYVKRHCFCNGPETGKMVACNNDTCTYRWFHFSSVGLTRALKTKQWYCPQCRGEKEKCATLPLLIGTFVQGLTVPIDQNVIL